METSKEEQADRELMWIKIDETQEQGSLLTGNYNGKFVIQAISHLIRFIFKIANQEEDIDKAFQSVINIIGYEYTKTKDREVKDGSK